MSLLEIKYLIGVFAVILILIGYIPYFRDILNGKTIPHIYSWVLWGFVGFIIFALQFNDKAGAGAFVSLAAALIGSTVIILSLVIHKGKRDITKLDTVFFILAFISLGFWLIAKQPILSALVLLYSHYNTIHS